MSFEKLLFSTDTIPVIDAAGAKIAEIRLKEKIRPVPRRRCGISEQNLYYKGAGILYTGHFVNQHDETVKLVSEQDVLYEKYHVVYPALYRRFGIFTFPHQPIFSDCEGGCGKKEANLLTMQKNFQFSAIEEITDVLDTPLEHHSIYVYRMKTLSGGYHDTVRLIEYLLQENFNTPWDKNVWDDIVCFGYVRDLADWFISDLFSHKLGTVYGLLNTLIKKDKYLYEFLVHNLTGLEQLGDHHIIYLAALIVKRFSPNTVPDLDLSHPCEETYTALWNALYDGRACCHLENEAAWSFVRQELKKKIPSHVSLAMKDLFYHKMMLRR